MVVAAVLRNSLCVVSLLPCVADCCMLYTVCKVERFVLTIIKRRLLFEVRIWKRMLKISWKDEVTDTFVKEERCMLNTIIIITMTMFMVLSS